MTGCCDGACARDRMAARAGGTAAPQARREVGADCGAPLRSVGPRPGGDRRGGELGHERKALVEFSDYLRHSARASYGCVGLRLQSRVPVPVAVWVPSVALTITV